MKEHDYGPGDWQTWKPCTNHPNDPRTEEPDDDFMDKSDPREMDLDITNQYQQMGKI